MIKAFIDQRWPTQIKVGAISSKIPRKRAAFIYFL
jgi:hypothetical protein